MSRPTQLSTRTPSETERSQPEQHLITASRLLGRKWRLVIVHHLLEDGPMGFAALNSRIDRISSKVLSDNLTGLEAAGLLTREIIQEQPIRVEYALTPAGEQLAVPLEELLAWSREHGVAVQEGNNE
jgi:DNA-binding HxlR family transcriptional regulator